jgi:hypothetical protein
MIDDLAIKVGIIITDTGTSSSFPNITMIVTIEYGVQLRKNAPAK